MSDGLIPGGKAPGELPSWWPEAVMYAKHNMPKCVCRGMGFVYADVQPGDPLWGKAIPCICRLDKILGDRARQLRRMSGMSDLQLQTMTFSTFDVTAYGEKDVQAVTKIRNFAQQWARDPKGWMLFIGQYGSGKTHLAYAVAGQCLVDSHAVYMNTMPGILDMLREGYSHVLPFEDRMRLLQEVDVLVIDDLGSENVTEWSREKLYEVIDRRYVNHLPMVVTSNVDLVTDAGIDPRIRSRLSEGTKTSNGWSRVFHMPDQDLRPTRKRLVEGD